MRSLTSSAALLLSLSLAGQQWQRLPSTAHPPKDAFVAMAYDAGRERLVCLAEEVISVSPPPYYFPVTRRTTWEWDGARWLQRVTATTPPKLGATAYDPTQRRVVLVTSAGETWSFDGTDWQQEPIAGPMASSLAFDPVRGVLVLAGGSDPGNHGLYEVVNHAWTLRASLAPTWHSTVIGFDPLTARMLAFGGVDQGSLAPDVSTTWAWDGAVLTVLSPATVPSGRRYHVLVNDAATGQLVMMGGARFQGGVAVLADVHAWNGADWVAQASLPSPRAGAAAAPLGGLTWLFGGRDSWTSPSYSHEMLLRAAGVWTTLPLPVSGTCAAHDTVRSRTVSVRNGRTLEFDGYQWIDVAIPFPGFAAITAIAFHAQTARLVAFDGAGTTWLYDGLAWTQAVTPIAPPPRELAGMGYDPTRNVVVLFGGISGGTHLGDVWEWNGATWTNPLPANTPTPGAAAIAWDGQALRVIVTPFWGYWATWTWNGATWSYVANCSLASNQTTAPRLAHDPALGLVAIVRPVFGDGDYAFQLTGGVWQPIASGILERSGAGSLVFDGIRAQLVLHDGQNERDLILSTQLATQQPYGAGCGGVAPRLTAPVLPQLGTVSISDVDRATANSFAFLLGDLAQTSVALPGGCTALLQNPIVLAGAPTNGAGFSSLGVAIPPAPALRGIHVFEQALVLDPAGALVGFADLTNGLRLRIGD